MIVIGLLAARGSKAAGRHELMLGPYLWRDAKASVRRIFPFSCCFAAGAARKSSKIIMAMRTAYEISCRE